jgi:hypothetical protein
MQIMSFESAGCDDCSSYFQIHFHLSIFLLNKNFFFLRYKFFHVWRLESEGKLTLSKIILSKITLLKITTSKITTSKSIKMNEKVEYHFIENTYCVLAWYLCHYLWNPMPVGGPWSVRVWKNRLRVCVRLGWLGFKFIWHSDLQKVFLNIILIKFTFSDKVKFDDLTPL